MNLLALGSKVLVAGKSVRYDWSMMTAMQAEGLLNTLRDVHECGPECAQRCILVDLDPNLPADREMLRAMSAVAA